MELMGRRVIYTDEECITPDNVLAVLESALSVHKINASEISYLWNYYRGKQPVLSRTKEVRPEILNKVVENHAEEIVSFKNGYLLGEPIQYVNASGRNDLVERVKRLNAHMWQRKKISCDQKIGEWMHVAGVGYRIVMPRRPLCPDDAPYEFFSLDPRQTFVVYYSGLGNKPVMNVHYIKRENGVHVFTCYTANWYFLIEDSTIISSRPQTLGLPIIEYPLNEARLGAFEVVLPIMDAINSTDSNRLDGVEQFIQALMLFHNVDISTDDFEKLQELGAIKFKDIDAATKAEVKYLTAELNQTQVQTLVDHLYDTLLIICGMPNRNGGSSTSDTGSAVILRDGWSDAEARAKRTENMFKDSEVAFLSVVLHIYSIMGDLELGLSDIDIRFTRRNYENINNKATVLTTMLGSDKIHPLLAFEHCGMFSDPNSAYLMSEKYFDSLQAKKEVPASGDDKADKGAGPDGD